jgi:hypothetical protein
MKWICVLLSNLLSPKLPTADWMLLLVQLLGMCEI